MAVLMKLSSQRQLTLPKVVWEAMGSPRWFETVKVPLVNDDGTCSHVLGVAPDITDRTRAEDADAPTLPWPPASHSSARLIAASLPQHAEESAHQRERETHGRVVSAVTRGEREVMLVLEMTSEGETWLSSLYLTLEGDVLVQRRDVYDSEPVRRIACPGTRAAMRGRSGMEPGGPTE